MISPVFLCTCGAWSVTPSYCTHGPSLSLSHTLKRPLSLMQYEDSEGYLWTEEQDDDGYVYFVNANTMASVHNTL